MSWLAAQLVVAHAAYVAHVVLVLVVISALEIVSEYRDLTVL